MRLIRSLVFRYILLSKDNPLIDWLSNLERPADDLLGVADTMHFLLDEGGLS